MSGTGELVIEPQPNKQVTGNASGPRIAAVIPALDEAPSIARVVGGLRALGVAGLEDVIVVDNGSTDGTGDIARGAGATVVREERRGYGYACRAGVLAANDADVIVLLDGDAADDPGDLPKLLEPLLGGVADLVVGSRVVEPGSMTWPQIIGNHLTAWLIRNIYRVRVGDIGPFRTIRRDDLLALDMGEMSYGWSVEMVAKSARAGYRYHEVPVAYHRRIGTSKVSGTFRGSVMAGWYMLATTLRYSRWSPRAGGGDPRASEADG